MPTHGALSKAGKVRMQTPKIERQKEKSSSGPKVSNRKLYHNRVELAEISVNSKWTGTVADRPAVMLTR